MIRKNNPALAFLAAGLLILASTHLFPAFAAVNCAPSWEQGTLANGNWTAGSGTDYRVQCVGDGDGDVLRHDDLPPPPQGASRLVVEASGTITASGNGTQAIRINASESQGVARIVVVNRGSITTSGEEFAYGIDLRRASGAGAEARAVNKGTVTTSGIAGHGVFARIEGAGAGTAIAINEGNISTSGGTHTWEGRLIGSDGLKANNRGTGDAVAINEAGASIHTSGNGADGVQVSTDNGGDATATNRGTVTVTGNYAIGTETVRFASTYGVTAAANGGGNARAINEAGGVITTGSTANNVRSGGDGTKGLHTYTEGAGRAHTTNHGTITTFGEPITRPDGQMRHAMGVEATSRQTNSGQVSSLAENTGTVTTWGQGANGVLGWLHAGASGDTVTADNSGSVATNGGDASAVMAGIDNSSGSVTVEARNSGTVMTSGRSAEGVFAWSRGGGAGYELTAVNSGTVTTTGARAFGVFAGIGADSSSTTVEARNSNSVTTTGDDAQGVIAYAAGGGTTGSPNRVEAYNDAGATISTATDGSGALGASIRINAGAPEGGVDAFGSIHARNDGTITTAGGDVEGSPDNLAYGMSVSFWTNDGTTINNAGNVEAINTGTITVTGPMARGIEATTFGNGTATITVDGGTIIASHDSADNAEDGVGIYAMSGAGGRIISTIADSVIRAPQAVLFEGAPATLTLTDSGLTGRMSFADGDDIITARGHVAVVSDVDFGAGTDRLILDVTRRSVWTGNLTGLEYLTKRGSAACTIDGDLTFSGSSVVVAGGDLVITGHMNLGSAGTVEVHDGTRLTGLLTQGSTPKITAGGGTTVESGGTVTMQQEEGVSQVDAEEAVTTFLADANVQGGAEIPVHTQEGDGSLIQLATFDPSSNTATAMAGASVGMRADMPEESSETETPTPPTSGTPTSGTPNNETPVSRSGSGGSGGSGVVLGGGVLLLLLGLLDLGPDEAADPTLSTKPGFVQTVDGESRYWARNLGEAVLLSSSIDRAEGAEVGMDIGIGNGLSLGFTTAMNVTAQRTAGAEATALSGNRYGVRGSWQGDAMFARLSLSHGDWQADGSYVNPTVGGSLRGRFDAVQNDIRAGAGVRVDLGGGFALIPQTEVFAGEVQHKGHMAEGALFRASIPGVTQRYSGVKTGLGFASGWQEGPKGLKLRPSLKLTAMHTRTESPDFDMRQSDRLGVLSTTSRGRFQDAPETVFGFGGSLDAESGGVRMRLGYGGVIMDGKVDHVVAVGLKTSF